jgi:hypothetical protein
MSTFAEQQAALLYGPEDVGSSGMKIIVLNSVGQFSEVPAGYFTSEPLKDGDGNYLFESDVGL